MTIRAATFTGLPVRMAGLYKRKWLLIRLPVVALAVATAVWLWRVVFPMPPARLSISTAATDGAYYRHAQRYAEKFAAHGITLDVQTSAGSQQNLERLRNPAAPSDLAFMQGGFGYLGTSLERHDRSPLACGSGVQGGPRRKGASSPPGQLAQAREADYDLVANHVGRTFHRNRTGR